MKTKKFYRFIIIMAMLLALIIVGSASAATVTIKLNETEFTALGGAEVVPIPDEHSLPVMPFGSTLIDYSCISGSTGISLASGSISVNTAVNYICILDRMECWTYQHKSNSLAWVRPLLQMVKMIIR